MPKWPLRDRNGQNGRYGIVTAKMARQNGRNGIVTVKMARAKMTVPLLGLALLPLSRKPSAGRTL
jgi:hypothetical protein